MPLSKNTNFLFFESDNHIIKGVANATAPDVERPASGTLFYCGLRASGAFNSCLSLWERPSQSPTVTALPEGEPRRESQELRVSGISASITLPLPLGEVAERSEDGEGPLSEKTRTPFSVV